MKISVAMTTYNGAPYLRAQLDSISGQTRVPDEVVISDDGSTDGSQDIVRDWMASHPGLEVRLIDGPPTGGFNSNFLRAFAAVTGDLVFVADQDDVWMPEKIAVMSGRIAADPEAMLAIHDLELVDGDLTPVGQTQMARAHAFRGPMEDHNIGMACVMRAGFVKSFTEIPPGFIYDNWVNLCAREVGGKRVAEAVLALYRRHGKNASPAQIIGTPGRQSLVGMRIAWLREIWRKDAGGGDLRRRSEVMGAVALWARTHRETLLGAGVPVARLDACIARAEAAQAICAERLSIRRRGRLARLLPVVRLMRAGRYADFQGRGSAAKDLVLPRLRPDA